MAVDKDFTDHKCVALHSFKDSSMIDIRYVIEGNRLINSKHLCTSHYTENIDGPEGAKVIRCLTPDRNVYQDESQLVRFQGAGLDCIFTQFDKDNSTKGVNITDVSFCGFNRDTSGYCKKRKGDVWFTDAYQRLIRIGFDKINCHILSDGETCSSMLSSVSSNTNNVINNFYRALKDVEGEIGWPVYADNDICVRETITNVYWDYASDNAMNTQIVSGVYLISAILLISFLI